MFKKLPLALMMGAALSAGNAFGLGMGDIKIDSALNQRLDAEIELISSIEGELDDVTVSLAPPSAFHRINLERPYHLLAIGDSATIETAVLRPGGLVPLFRRAYPNLIVQSEQRPRVVVGVNRAQGELQYARPLD